MFDAVVSAWQIIFGWLPSWFQGAVIALLVMSGAILLIGIALRIKDLLWPF